MDATNQDIQCDAQGYSTDRVHIVGRHLQNADQGSVTSQQHGQRMPYNNMGGIAFGVPQSNFSGIPPEYEHFDVALLYAKEDLELALDIRDKLRGFELRNKMYPKICLYDDSCFVASQMERAENVVKLCTLIFVVLTENLRDDMVVQAVREEAFGLTRIATKDECDTTKRYCIRPLHTKSEKDRKGVYKTPSGLLAIDSVDWYNYEKKSFQYRLKKLFDHHLPYRLKRENQDFCGNSFQTAQIYRSFSSDKPNGNMQSMQGQLNMQVQAAMYGSHFREGLYTVQGNPPPPGLESENHGQSGVHGNTSVPNIFPTEHRLTPPRANTSRNPVYLAHDAQPQGSVDQGPGIDPVLIEKSRQRFETASHGNTIHHPQQTSSNIHQESLQTDEQNLSVNLSQIHVSDARPFVNRGGQEGHGCGNSSFEADVQPSRSLSGAQTGGLTGPDRGDTDNCINGRSSTSQNVPKHDCSPSDKPSSVTTHYKTLSEKSSEQQTAASSSSSTVLRNNLPQYQSPLNTADNANPSEIFRSLPEDDLVIEPDLDEDGIQINATKSKGKLFESSRSEGESSCLSKCEDEESTVVKSVNSSQGTNRSIDTTAIKDMARKDNGSVTSNRFVDVADQEPCHNSGEDNDNKSGIGSCDTTEPSQLTADEIPSTNPATITVIEGLCDDLPRNHRGTSVSGQGPKKNIGTVASGSGDGQNLVTAASSPCSGCDLGTFASDQGQRDTPGKDDNEPSDGSGSLGQKPSDNIDTVGPHQGPRDGSASLGQKPSDDIDTVGPHQGPRDGSGSLGQKPSDNIDTVGPHQGPRDGSGSLGQKPSDDIDTVGPHRAPRDGSPSPPLAPRTPGDGQSLADQKVTLAKQIACSATQTSNADKSNTVSVKPHITSGSAKHRVLDKVTKPLETYSALSNNLKTPLAKQGIEEINKVLTHELKTDGPAYTSSAKCAAPNVLKSSAGVPPISPAPVLHYHYHAGNQGPGMFDPSVFTLLEEPPQFTPHHVNGPPHYPGQPAAPPAQNPQQHGPVNMSQQAPINIVNCKHVQIGSDGKMIIGSQHERMTDREEVDPYDSLTSAASNREDSPPPYSVQNPSFPASTYRKTPLTDGIVIPSQTEPRGGNPPYGEQEAVIADVSQSRAESLGNASGLTRDGPRSCFPSERTGNERRQVLTGLSDLHPHWDSASGLSDITSFTVSELGSASDFLEMVRSELSEDRDSSFTGKGETTLPTVCSNHSNDDSQLTTEDTSNPSTLNATDGTFFCADKRRKQVYLNIAKPLLQQCNFQHEGKSMSVDSELD
ncbi:uncharacterized protein [Haliotis asinina]|uniref:uncharacterized protein n=1 Tax=Haliotis asinina TaxID=109174 RepID=UPI0035321234